MVRADPALLQAIAIALSIRRQRQKLHHQPLFSSPATLREKGLGVIWLLDIFATTVARA